MGIIAADKIGSAAGPANPSSIVRVIDHVTKPKIGDFRINDPEVLQKFYKLDHTAVKLQKKFIYGLTETNREAIKSAKYIANPVCRGVKSEHIISATKQNALLSEVFTD